MANNHHDRVERAVVAMTALALNCPSTFTIAWSKDEHKEELPILYAGIGTSLLTVLGAILGDRYHGDTLMWTGLAATMGLFGYVVFVYRPKNSSNSSKQVQSSLIIGVADDGNRGCNHLMVG